MTVENTQNKMPPLQMGTTNEYPFNFAVLLQDPTAEEALEAIKASVLQADGTEIELVYNTDYTVTLNTDRIGGTLTVNDIRTSGDYITIYRQYAQTQEVDYKDFNSAPAETFEQCFDKLTMLSQQQQEEINRSIKLPVSSDITNLSLPNPVAGRTLKWNESETGLINSDVSIDEIDDSVQAALEASINAKQQAEIASDAAKEVVEKVSEVDNIWSEIVEGNMFKLQIFDTVVKDHILTYEESKGLALQGTWIYKDAIAGERYGYADFYNKCLEEYENAENTKQWLKSNVNYVGYVVDNQGVLSGFSSTSWAVLPNNFNVGSSAWELVVSFTTGTIGTDQYIVNSSSLAYQPFGISISAGGKIVANGYKNNSTTTLFTINGSSVLSANTKYLVTLSYDSITGYTLKLGTSLATLTDEGTSTVTTPINTGYNIALGADFSENGAYYGVAFTGSIDLKESYININGERWWDGVEMITKNPNGHIFYDIADKDIIDSFFESTGTAWFYGIDTENERIFLPRDKYFAVNGIAPVVGNGKAVTWTNGTSEGTFSTSHNSNYICHSSATNLNVGATASHSTWSPDLSAIGITTDPTKSGVEAHLTANEDKYLYICVGNTVSDTSWVDVVTQVEGGVKDLEDKTLEGIERLKQSSTALTQTQITNCLLEVPQNIKLELNNGVLTLKAGSIVTVPNGKNADGSLKFDYVTVESDLSSGTISTTLATRAVFINADNYTFADGSISYVFSGNTSVMNATTPYNYSRFYNIEVNKMYTGNGTSWDERPWCLPIAIATNDSTGKFTSIDQTFNGMGYIGSTVWIDKGVKGLIPNGRNEDGTLKNIEVVTNNVLTRTVANNISLPITLFLNPTNTGLFIPPSKQVVYDKINNITVNNVTGERYYSPQLATFYTTNGVVSNFNPKQPFRAVDYNDIAGLKAYITETYVNGTSWYRVWSDGWIEQGGYSSSMPVTVTLLKAFSNTNYTVQATMNSNNNVGNYENLAISNKATTGFKIYQHTISNAVSWYACGY